MINKLLIIKTDLLRSAMTNLHMSNQASGSSGSTTMFSDDQPAPQHQNRPVTPSNNIILPTDNPATSQNSQVRPKINQ